MNYQSSHWLPGLLNEDGTRGPPAPCPDLLTPEEAARYLRLDGPGIKDPVRNLHDLRSREGLPCIKINGRIVFRRDDLIKFTNELSRR